MTTTPVVPSPISWSWLFESSTRSLPIWFSTSICSKMVAPSLAASGDRSVIRPHTCPGKTASWERKGNLLMHTSPSPLCSILSMPLGPRDDCNILEIVLAACMFAF